MDNLIGESRANAHALIDRLYDELAAKVYPMSEGYIGRRITITSRNNNEVECSYMHISE